MQRPLDGRSGIQSVILRLRLVGSGLYCRSVDSHLLLFLRRLEGQVHLDVDGILLPSSLFHAEIR